MKLSNGCFHFFIFYFGNRVHLFLHNYTELADSIEIKSVWSQIFKKSFPVGYYKPNNCVIYSDKRKKKAGAKKQMNSALFQRLTLYYSIKVRVLISCTMSKAIEMTPSYVSASLCNFLHSFPFRNISKDIGAWTMLLSHDILWQSVTESLHSRPLDCCSKSLIINKG